MPEGQNKGQDVTVKQTQIREKDGRNDDFVLEKSIFSNIFEKDIRRVFIYKKAERLAKAIHLISPVFADSPSLRDRMDGLAIGLVDAAIEPPLLARTALSRELLALSSVLAIARTSGLLSSMNAELISREAHQLLQEIAAYEEPRLFLDEAPTLADIAKHAGRHETPQHTSARPRIQARAPVPGKEVIKDKESVSIKDRRESILSVISSHGGPVSIKDISTLIRTVSEKTIQRELQALVEAGTLIRSGERRWSTYSLA